MRVHLTDAVCELGWTRSAVEMEECGGVPQWVFGRVWVSGPLAEVWGIVYPL